VTAAGQLEQAPDAAEIQTARREPGQGDGVLAVPAAVIQMTGQVPDGSEVIIHGDHLDPPPSTAISTSIWIPKEIFEAVPTPTTPKPTVEMV
jgi:hypothetical protein